jgi:hypothetical protein
MGSPSELQRYIAPTASDIEAVCVVRDPDAIEELGRAGGHDPRDEAQPLAPLRPATDDVSGLASHDHILLPEVDQGSTVTTIMRALAAPKVPRLASARGEYGEKGGRRQFGHWRET